MFRRSLAVCVLVLTSSGCVIGDGSGTSSSGGASSGGASSGGASSGDPDVDALFATLAKATPGKLAGVWSTTSKSASGDAEIRFRFAPGKIIGGVKCTYPSQGNTTLSAGATTTLTTTDLDGNAGQFRIGDTLSFQKTSGQLQCVGRLDNLSYTFQIDGTVMLLGATEAAATASFTKVGD